MNRRAAYHPDVITNQTFDLDAIRRDSRLIYERVGAIVVACAGIDQWLGALLAKVSTERVPVRFSARVDRLAGLAPGSLALFVARVRDAGDFRDRLAHSVFVVTLRITTGEVVRDTRRERNNLRPEQLDVGELAAREIEAEVLSRMLHAMHFDGQISTYHPRQIALDLFSEPDTEYRAAIDRLFPDAG